MLDLREYTLTIDAFTPVTLPMARLVEYLADLSKLLGRPESVHFLRVEEGSAKLAYQVEELADPEVTDRVVGASAGVAPVDALRAYGRLNSRLIEDRSAGRIARRGGTEIIRFPGFVSPTNQAADIRVPMQEDILDGVVQRVGRIRGEAAVLLEAANGTPYRLRCDRVIAKRFAAHLFEGQVRVRGYAKWLRRADGIWNLSDFKVHDFDLLDDAPLSVVVQQLRSVPNSDWNQVEDPWRELEVMRHGDPEDGS